VVNNISCGTDKLKKKFENNKTDKSGIFIIQEFSQNVGTFRDFFKDNRFTKTYFNKLLAQLMYVLNTIQNLCGMVHNDLWGANLLVVKLNEEKKFEFTAFDTVFKFSSLYCIKLIDFDNASYSTVKGKRVSSKDGYEAGKSAFMNDHYDISYLLGSLQDLVESREMSAPDKYEVRHQVINLIRVLYNKNYKEQPWNNSRPENSNDSIYNFNSGRKRTPILDMVTQGGMNRLAREIKGKIMLYSKQNASDFNQKTM